MLVGEAPGAEEDKQGKPFVGMSGQLLDRMMATIGQNRTSFYISNILPWRPPFNRQPSADEIVACMPFIERHIALISPKALLCVGSVASRALLRTTDSMKSLHNQIIPYTSDYLSKPIPAFVIYHPAYLLRSPGQKKTAWHQLLRLAEFLKNLNSFL
jgi:uracil-DNA glycosylase family 4